MLGMTPSILHYMIVKQLHLFNYKNYRDTKWEDINPHMNVIVGRNGIGKSTIYSGTLCFPSSSIPILFNGG